MRICLTDVLRSHLQGPVKSNVIAGKTRAVTVECIVNEDPVTFRPVAVA